jgi:hypothetical protein
VDAIAGFGELVGAIVAGFTLAGGARAWYRRTVGRRRSAYRALQRLGTHAQLSFFTAVLGEPPAISRSIPRKDRNDAVRSRPSPYIARTSISPATTLFRP